MEELLEQYSEYAFIDQAEPEAEANAEAGAIVKWAQIIERTYEEPDKWYLVVFKPFNKTYSKWLEWYTFKGLDNCRKYFKRPTAYIMTREIEAQKVHINALVCTSTPPVDGVVYNNKYKVYVSELSTLGDRRRVLAYITKEFRNRPYNLYLDYLYGPRA